MSETLYYSEYSSPSATLLRMLYDHNKLQNIKLVRIDHVELNIQNASYVCYDEKGFPITLPPMIHSLPALTSMVQGQSMTCYIGSSQIKKYFQINNITNEEKTVNGLSSANSSKSLGTTIQFKTQIPSLDQKIDDQPSIYKPFDFETHNNGMDLQPPKSIVCARPEDERRKEIEAREEEMKRQREVKISFA